MGVGIGESISQQAAANIEQNAVTDANIVTDLNEGLQDSEALLQAESAAAQTTIPEVDAKAGEQIHTHDLADGTTVSASYAEAVKVCPAMAGMSLKQVALAAKLQARGREKMQREKAAAETQQPAPKKDNQTGKNIAHKPEKLEPVQRQAVSEAALHVTEQQTVGYVAAESVAVQTNSVDKAQPVERRRHLPDEAMTVEAIIADDESLKATTIQKPELKLAKPYAETVIKISTPRLIELPKPEQARRPVAEVVQVKKVLSITEKPKVALVKTNVPSSLKAPELLKLDMPPTAKIIEFPSPKRIVQKAETKQPLATVYPLHENVLDRTVDLLDDFEPLNYESDTKQSQADELELLDYGSDYENSAEDVFAEAGNVGKELAPMVSVGMGEVAAEPEAHPAQIVVEHFKERVELPPQYVEPVEVFVATLPPTVQEKFTEFIATHEPEEVVAVEELTVNIAVMAERLHVLETGDHGAMTPEQVALETEVIEEKIAELYTEFLTTLGVEVQPEMITAFLQLVRSEEYTIEAAQLALVDYDPMLEHDHHRDLDSLAKLGGTVHKLSDYVGRHAVWNSSFGARDVLFAA